MTAFRFDESVPLPPGAIVTAALGTSGAPYTDKEVGKAVKIIGDSNYGSVANNDALEGVVTSVEPGTVKGGISLGGVQRWLPGMRLTVRNNAATALVINDFVKCTAQAAVGTANAGAITPIPLIQKGDGTERFAWRVVSLLGSNGAQNTEVLVEAVSTTAGAS